MKLTQPVETLLPDVPRPQVRYEVKVTLVRAADSCAPPDDQVLAELAAAALCVDDLLTAWAADQAVLSMIVDAADDASALEAGTAVVRALGGTRGASVSAERFEGRWPIG